MKKILILLGFFIGGLGFAEEWRGLEVQPEYIDCPKYERGSNNYKNKENFLFERDNGKSVYDNTIFNDISESDIEHVVAYKEAWDSGLCFSSPKIKKDFKKDTLNLVLATPSLNRHQKSDKDAADWIPKIRQCEFAGTIINVKNKYKLTVDENEKNALESLIQKHCKNKKNLINY